MIVNPQQSNAGDVITAAAINNPVNQLAAVINGGIDSTNITAGSITAASLAPSLASAVAGGYTALSAAPSTVTYSGNRSYQMVFNNVDLTGTLSPGMRLRTTRTVAAPTQSTALNGTTQFWSKTSPTGMTFTNAFATGAWVKLAAYGTAMGITSRFNGTSGWLFWVDVDGTVRLQGDNGAAGNYTRVHSYQSLPLNKWVHVAAQLDMSTGTVDATNSYIMIDGVNVPAVKETSGTNPTSLVQAGNFEIGSFNASSFFNGKIAQAFVTSAKVTQSTIQSYISQGLAGTEPNLVSAYSFNGNANDLNTTNANNLTANGSVTATAADSPFGGQAGGAISSTLDYGIVQATAFSTNTTVTVQVPEGCTIPTSGGVSAVVYSSNKVPYGFPSQRGKWTIETHINSEDAVSITAINTWFLHANKLTVPIGEWTVGYELNHQLDSGTGQNTPTFLLSSSTPVGGTYNQELSSSYSQSSVSVASSYLNKIVPQTITIAATYIAYTSVQSAGTTAAARIRGSQSNCRFVAENAYL